MKKLLYLVAALLTLSVSQALAQPRSIPADYIRPGTAFPSVCIPGEVRSDTASSVKVCAASGTSWTTLASGGGSVSGLTAGRVAYATGATTIGGSANFVWDNTNNRVGINQATPLLPLHVKSASSSVANIESNVGYFTMGFDSLGGYFQPATASRGFWFYPTTGANGMMGIDANGLVGVGTTSPSTRLTVARAGEGLFTLNNSSAAVPNYTIGIGSGSQHSDGYFFIDAASTPTVANQIISAAYSATQTLVIWGKIGDSAGSIFRSGNTVAPLGIQDNIAAATAQNGLEIGNMNQGSSTISSGIRRGVIMGSSGFAPTSGTGVFNQLELSTAINQTGGASGITRGIYINPTLTAAADWRGLDILASYVNTSGTLQNVYVRTDLNAASASSATVQAFQSDTRTQGSQNYTSSTGLQAFRATFTGYGTGTITWVKGFNAYLDAFNSIVTNAAALYATGIAASGAGSVGTKYGLYIENQTGGTTANYAIYSAGGANYLAGHSAIGAGATVDQPNAGSTALGTGAAATQTLNIAEVHTSWSGGAHAGLKSTILMDPAATLSANTYGVQTTIYVPSTNAQSITFSQRGGFFSYEYYGTGAVTGTMYGSESASVIGGVTSGAVSQAFGSRSYASLSVGTTVTDLRGFQGQVNVTNASATATTVRAITGYINGSAGSIPTAMTLVASYPAVGATYGNLYNIYSHAPLSSTSTAHNYALYIENQVYTGNTDPWAIYSLGGANYFVADGALSKPGFSIIGTPITGGSATTTKPLVLVEGPAATSTGWSTSGTMLGVNAPSGFTGNMLDLQVNGASYIQVTPNYTIINRVISTGAISANGGELNASSSSTQTTLFLKGGNSSYQITDTSGKSQGVALFTILAPAAGSTSYVAIDNVPTLNSSGTFSGTLTATRISAYLQSTTGATAIKLLDVGTNSAASGGGTHTSVFSVNSTGAALLNVSSSTTVPLTVKGAASQSANLQEWQNSSGTVLSAFDSAGRLQVKANTINAQGLVFYDSSYGIGMDASDLVIWGNSGQGVSIKKYAASGYNGTNFFRFDSAASTLGATSTSLIGWSSGSTLTAYDTAFSRISAGVIGVGTGAAGSTAGSLSMTGLTLAGNFFAGPSTIETFTSTGSAIGATLNYYTDSQTIYYSTAAAANDVTLNVDASASVDLNTRLATGQVITVVLAMTNTGTAYKCNTLQIHTVGQTIKWVGGSAPTGTINSTDFWTFTIMKTGASTYYVTGSKTSYS